MLKQSVELVKRIISALVLLPIVLFLAHTGGWPLFALITFATFVALWEYTTIVDKADPKARLFTVVLGTAAAAAAMQMSSVQSGVVVVQLAAVALAIFFTIRTGEFESAWQRLCLHAFGLLYIALAMVCIFFVRGLGDGMGEWQAPTWIYVVMMITWCNDTAAYFAGRAFGKHKFYEKVSPKKTWEGFAGGVVGAVGALFLVRAIFPNAFGHFSSLDLLCMGLPGAALGPLGDLAESLLKRNFKVKDSGNTIPGHGGILDRIDALFFVAPWVLFYGTVIRPLLN